MKNCIFCKIISGEVPCYKIWEDQNHIAFLSIFPNTKGFTVVATKEHRSSYIFENDKKTVDGIMEAAREVANLIDTKMEDVGRTGVIFEGFGVDHLHAKLFPMHGTKNDEWKQHISDVDKYFEKYEGYISSHDYKRADDKELEEIAKLLSE